MAIREIAKRLAKGGGIGESISGGVKAGLKQYSPGNIMKRAFSGDDLLSSFIRGRFADKKPTRTKTTEVDKKKDEAPVYISIIAKNSMSLPGMARDMNVLRQNIVKLVKLQGGATTKFGGKADDFFMREDAREQALEDARKDYDDSPTVVTDDDDKKSTSILGKMASLFKGFFGGKEGKGNFLSNIFKNIVKVIGGTFKKVFGGKILKGIGQALLRAFPIALLLGGLFIGLKEAWKRYQDTGDFGEAIVAGLGKVLEFATFGLFGEDTIKSVIEKLNTFFEPFKETFSKIWNGITGVFTKIASALGFDFSAPEMPDIKPEISAPPADSVDTSTEAFKESYTSDAKPDEVTTTSTSPVSVKSGSKGIDLMSGGVTPVAEQKVTADSSYLQKTSAVESPQNNMMNNFLNLSQGSGKAQTDAKSQGTSGPTYNNNMNLNAVEDVPPNIELKGNSGGALGSMSSDVAMGKMMEPYAGSMSNNIVDASKKNSAVGSAGGTSDMPIANVYDDDLVELLVGT